MNTKQAFEELKALGAKVELLDGGIKLTGDWKDKYNDYHESIVEITGELDTSETTQHPDFLQNLKSLDYLNTSHAIQHPDFLRNLTSLGKLYAWNTIQHQDFLQNLTTLAYFDTSHTIQHQDFLQNVKTLGYLDTSYSIQHQDFLQNVKTLGRLYTSYSIQHQDFLRNVTTLGKLDTALAIQHQDFLKGASDEFELPFIYADGILSEVTSTKVIDGITVHKAHRVGFKDIEFIATDGKLYAHANTLKMALIDLRFKQSDRDTSWLEDKTTDDVLSFDDAVLAYRCITGACSGGVEGFLRNQHEQKEEYQIKEIMELTKNEYGSKQFASFFN